MSRVADVLAPPNEDGTRATILRWCKLVGEAVLKDEPLVELETDKVTVEVPAPASGRLIEVLKAVNAEVTPDEVLARLSLDGESTSPKASALPESAPSSARLAAARSSPHAHPGTSGGRAALSPAVRRLLNEHSIAAADIQGTGRGGRITADDVMRQVNGLAARPKAMDSRIAHTAIRRRVAEHMVRSLADAPHVTTLFEADLTRVLKHRSLHSASFDARGTRLTLTAYFVSACARALRAHPEVNATFHEDALQLHGDVNIGVGTALGNKGLIVPVIHSAQDLKLFELAQRLNQLVEAARAGKLNPQDVRGGTFTISNHGVGGSLLAAPIVINQPQVAILGVGKVERRVCVVEAGGEESIGVRSMCYLTLTIDHRALDAFQANAFLHSVVTTLQEWPEAENPGP
jgi:2-oxoglutarate dehydrogenase E2 component (dihydrolipoamide succinyltransferase)